MDDSNYVGIVFFHLVKAFDRVWHTGLLEKLRAADIRGSAHEWFVSFLSNRRQATSVDGSLSSFSTLHAGVPQGAILSPLLFSVYMNDIPSYSPSTASLTKPPSATNLFADDTSLYAVEKSFDRLSTKLQERVDTLSAWFDKWPLTVNTDKTAVMVLRSRGMSKRPINIRISTTPSPQVESHCHLGLVFHETLSWSPHVDYVCGKVSSRLGLLRRLRQRTSQLVVRDLYLYCVRPVTEYASVAWCGLSVTDAARLERCNRAAGRLIAKICQLSHTDHNIILARAGLQPLSRSRQYWQALFTHRLLSGAQPGHLLAVLADWLPSPSARPSSMPLRNQACLRLPRPKKNILKSSPLYVSFSLWNSLSSSALSNPSDRASKLKDIFLHN